MVNLLALQSTVRTDYDRFFWILVIVCGSVATAIAVFLIYSAWRYRRRDPDELPSQVAVNVPAESLWIGIPCLIFIGMFLYGAKLYFDIERAPDNAEVVYVEAKQWMWKLQHENGIREINALHVPVGRAIRLEMISQDVIHSFYVPAFRIKQDVLPGRYTSIWFEVTKPGTYHLFCAEFCGTNHSQMRGWVYALEPGDYNRWLQQGGDEGSLADTGEKLFHQFACANCHHFAGHGPGPNLVGLYGSTVKLEDGSSTVADDAYLRRHILTPAGLTVEGFHSSIMPTYQGQLNEEELIALIAYIKSLGPRPPEGVGNPADNSANQSTPQLGATPPNQSPASLQSQGKQGGR